VGIYSMIEVVATMCLVGTTLDIDPHDLMTNKETRKSCRSITRTYHEDPSKITPHACMQNAAKFTVEWMRTHPGYKVRIFGCRPYKGQNDV